eukprot:scaffold174_cov98-Cylindrotheca_fusiformis.AAC.2
MWSIGRMTDEEFLYSTNHHLTQNITLIHITRVQLHYSAPSNCCIGEPQDMTKPTQKLPVITSRMQPLILPILLVLALDTSVSYISAFHPSCVAHSFKSTRLFSSVGGGADPPPPDPDDGDDGGGLDDFLNPKQESENLRKAREFMSETSLPISYDDDGDDTDDDKKDAPDNSKKSDSSALVGSFASSKSALFAGPSDAQLAKNPYMQVVSKLSPSDLISKFTATAHPRVQEAVRSTVLGLIGSLPKMAFDTTTITTGQRLASLMFQLQMTGYMFKNAEYRLSLSQSLGMTKGKSSKLLLSGDTEDEEQDMQDKLLSGKVKGKVKVRLGSLSAANNVEEAPDNSSNNGTEIEVDAAAYMSELRSEVSKLKEELKEHSNAKEEALRKDLLLYIRTLPAQELKSLTNTMSQDVLVCMKGLVQAVLSGIGDGKIAADTVTEQSGEAMAQLCMWQLAVGYNLRELEVREELKKNLSNMLDDGDSSGVDLSQPDSLQ